MRSLDHMLLVLAFATAGCADGTTSRTAAVEPSCGTWTVDEAIMIWPPDHAMSQYSLDDCVNTAMECPPPPTQVCGDGVLDPGEGCDDGNTDPFDGCDDCILIDIGPDVWSPPSESLTTG